MVIKLTPGNRVSLGQKDDRSNHLEMTPIVSRNSRQKILKSEIEGSSISCPKYYPDYYHLVDMFTKLINSHDN